MSNGPKDAIAAFGILSAIVAVWQFMEMSKDKGKTASEHKDLRARLERIEKKLDSRGT
jgi:hypothetical protein